MRGDSSFGYLWLFVSALYPAAMVTAIVHEFGHAAATWLVGARVYSITIGTGAPIWKLRSPTFELALGSNPFLGGEISHFYDQGAPRRWKEALVLVGGVTANAVVGATFFALLAYVDDRSDPSVLPTVFMVVLMALAISQCLAIIVNLWPRDVRREGQLRHTDGKRLVMLLGIGSHDFGEEAARRRLIFEGMSEVRAIRIEEARAHFESAWLDRRYDGALFSWLVHCTGKVRGPNSAARLYLDHRDELPATETSDPYWAFAFGSVAWCALMAGDREWTPLADQLSASAYAHWPNIGPIKATRGAALAMLGDFETGGGMIKEALPGISDRRDRAEFCEFLARHERAAGGAALAAEFSRMEQHLLQAA